MTFTNFLRPGPATNTVPPLEVPKATTRHGFLAALGLVFAAVFAPPQAAQGQLYASFLQGGRVGTFDPVTGAVIDPNFLNVSFPLTVVMSGNTVYVTNVFDGTIGTYDFNTRTAINASFITGLIPLQSFTTLLSGNNLYVGDQGALRLYDATTGASLNASLITGITPASVVETAAGLVVASNMGAVGLYDAATGAVISPSFLQGGGSYTSLALASNNLYAHSSVTGAVGLFDATTGAVINPNLVAGIGGKVFDILVNDGLIYIPDVAANTVRVYDANTGALINADFISGDVISLFINSMDLRPQTSAQNSGVAFGNATGQALLGSVQGMLADINGHLFSLRAGGGDDEDDNDDDSGLTASLDEGVTMGQGDGPEGGKNPVARKLARSSQWEVFTTVNFANVSLSAIGSQPGVDSYTWAPGVGVEKRVAPGLRLGFAANLAESHQTYSNGLGTLEMEGFGLSTYASYVKRDYWIDLLYSFGRFDLETERNPGFAFPVARGETTAYTNAVQLNGGWKFHIPSCKVTHGPFAGVDYLNVNVQDYNELGGGAAALAYASRSIDSLITRVGYSVSKRIDTNFATITPQLRVSYERQNISNNNGTSVNLINQPFTASSNAQAPGQDYLVAGAGVNFEFSPTLSLMLNYQGQFFRSDLQAHYAGARLSWKF